MKLKTEIYIVVYLYGSYLHIKHAITIDSGYITYVCITMDSGYITYVCISNFNSTHCKRESRLSCEDSDQSSAFNDYIKGVMAWNLWMNVISLSSSWLLSW